MTLPLFQIDAFASRAFVGNPAAVCPLEHWLDDTTMQAIAAENNLIGTEIPKLLESAFEASPQTVLKGSHYIVIFEDGTDLTALTPNYDALRLLRNYAKNVRFTISMFCRCTCKAMVLPSGAGA